MKLTIDRGILLNSLRRIQTIVERRGTLPILGNVLIDASDDQMTLTATDLEVGVTATQEAKVETPGSITLGAKKLYEIVRELEEPEVGLQFDDTARVSLESGTARFSLLSISPEEYPALPGDEGVDFVSLEAALLAEMIDHTLYAASNDETRYNLNGVFIAGEGDQRVCFVATDGHRLAKVSKALPEPVGFLGDGIIVPRKGVAEIRKVCDEANDLLEIGLSDGFLLLRRPGLLLSSRLIDGEFPKYQQIMPKDHSIRLVVARERLVHAVRRIALVAHERSHGVHLSLTEGQIELDASNPDLGEARETLQVSYTGEKFETGFNAFYLQDLLAAMSVEEVVVELKSELEPAQFRPAGGPDEVAVVMPMRM